MARSASGMDLPGCSSSNGCERALASSWATLFNVPVAVWGAAYTSVFLIFWLVHGGFKSQLMRRLSLVLSVGSIVWILAMLTERLFCVYCLAFHLSYLFFVGVGYPCGVHPQSLLRTRVSGLLSLVVVSVVFGVHTQLAAERRSHQQEVTQRSIAQIRQAADSRPAPSLGRFHRGSPTAAVQILAFIDYECLACLELEREVSSLLEDGADISFSIRHFPWCANCNRALEASSCNHQRACLAAAAVEAAGMLGGEAAYFQMHNFIVKCQGHFSFEDIREAAARFSLDSGAFDDAVESRAVQDAIATDITEARKVGLTMTPWVFVNGVKVNGAAGKDVLRAAVRHFQSLGIREDASGLSSRQAVEVGDLITQWQEAPQEFTPRHRFQWPPPELKFDADTSPARKGAIHVSIWGSYDDADSRTLDLRIRTLASEYPTAHVEFRHLPTAKRSRIQASAVEAAGLAGGESGFWAMHLWMMKHKGVADQNEINRLVAQLNIPESRFCDLMQSEEVQNSINEDISLAKRLDGQGLPILYICGRNVPTWKHGQHDILKELLDAASLSPSK